MLIITLNLDTGVAKAATSAVIRSGVRVPVKLICLSGGVASSPGNDPFIQIALGTDAAPPAIMAYLDEFHAENSSTFTGILNANDARLTNFMASKQAVTMNVEVRWTVDDESEPDRRLLQASPNFTVAVQPPIIQPGASSEGGPVYLSATEIAAIYATQASTLIPEPSTGKFFRLIFNEAGELSREEVV